MSCSTSSAIIGTILIFQKMAKRSLASKLSLQATFVLSLVLLSQLTLAENTDEHSEQITGLDEANAAKEVIVEATTTMQVETLNSTTHNTTTAVENSSSKSNTGAVVAASIIAVLGCCAIVLGVYLFKRRRQSRNLDKEKKMQIQMSSARNAGIYQDLTVSVPNDEKPNGSPEHERLKAVEDA
jgi:hypothetical protein